MCYTYVKVLEEIIIKFLTKLTLLFSIFTAHLMTGPSVQAHDYQLTPEQYAVLVAVVQQEGGDDYESATWVTSTILNRLKNPKFHADSLYDVITQPGQFEAYGAGHYYRYLHHTSETVKKAVNDTLEKGSVHSYHFFWGQSYAQMMGQGGQAVGGNVYFNY